MIDEESLAVEMNLSKHITKIDFNATKEKFTISTNQEQLDEAEAVIVTVPVPQVLTQLKGSIAQLISMTNFFSSLLLFFIISFFFKDDQKDVKEKLNQVKYSTRYAVGLFYPPSVISLNVPWRIYYVDKKDNEYLRFLAVDNAKRNQSSSCLLPTNHFISCILDQPPFSLIAHTSVEFGAQHTDDDKMVIGEQIKEKIFEFLPELPRNVSGTKYHKWKYSQVIIRIFSYHECINLI